MPKSSLRHTCHVLLFWCALNMVAFATSAVAPVDESDVKTLNSRYSRGETLSAQEMADLMARIPNPMRNSERPQRNPLDQGGENCATATVIPGIPYSDTGTTAGFIDDNYEADCPWAVSGSPDVVYRFTPVSNISVNISLCTNSTFDTWLYVWRGACPGELVACNDDFCSTPSYPSELVSSLSCIPLLANNTYYIVVDGYGGDAGAYSINVTNCALCDVVNNGCAIEGEPVCGPDYVDAWNPGCNSNPPVFSPIECNTCVFGTCGTFTSGVGDTRDTDWYRTTLTSPSTITWSVNAEFPVLIYLIDDGSGNCSDFIQLGTAVSTPCQIATLSAFVQAGTYWLWVGPAVYSGVPCGVEYIATLTCVPEAPCTPTEVTNLTLNRGSNSADNVMLKWSATDRGYYHVWGTTVTNNDGDPNNGADAQWTSLAVIPAPAVPGSMSYTHAPLAAYLNYVVVHDCAPRGRCCYEDLNGRQCSNPTSEVECTALQGSWTENLNCVDNPCPGAPVNDSCANAIQILNGTSISASTVNATTDDIWPCAVGGSDVWYYYTATATGMVTASLCGSTSGYDTALMVLESCGGPNLDCNDDGCPPYSEITFAATSGMTYRIAVGGYYAHQGAFTLLVTQ